MQHHSCASSLVRVFHADNPPTIFLSYARADDEPFVRRLYKDLTKRGFRVWFDREDMPSRGLTFNDEIRRAIAPH